MRATGIMLAALTISLPALGAPAPAIDNERVTVWDITLKPGESGPAAPKDKDMVVMFLEGGVIRTVSGGKTTTATRRFGDAVWVARGSEAIDTLVSGGPAHEIMVALKDHAKPAIPNTSGLPAAFPRPGSVKVLDNARVVTWHYSWKKGEPTPMHFHDKEVVVAYRYDGTLRSTTPAGTPTENAYKQGEIRFNLANRTHSELLLTDRQSAVMVELK